MQNAIFSSASESFLTDHIIHAGSVNELAQNNRKSNNTHYFRLTTTRGAAFCHFKSEEAARRARGVLGAMLGTIKPHLFRSKGDCIDVASIVSFGRVVKLKSDDENNVFGFPVNLNTVADKSATIWLTFQTEESSKNVRKALYAAIMSYYQPLDRQEKPVETSEVVESSDVVTEIEYVEV